MNKKKNKLSNLQNNEVTKVRYPKGKEFIGIVEKRLGGSRMHIRTTTGKEILARVPGRVKKYLWIREGNVVLLKPWELDEQKADLIYKFKFGEIKVLEAKGYLTNLENIEEF